MGSCFGKPSSECELTAAAIGIPVVVEPENAKEEERRKDDEQLLTLACIVAGWDGPFSIYTDLLAFAVGVTVDERRRERYNGINKQYLAIAAANDKCADTSAVRELFGSDYTMTVAVLAIMSSMAGASQSGPSENMRKLIVPPMDIMLRMSYERLRAFVMWRLQYIGWKSTGQAAPYGATL